MFLGAMGTVDIDVVVLANDTFTESATAPADATVTATMDNDGTLKKLGVTEQTWLLQGAAADYDVYVTNSGDALASGTLSTWLNLGTDRSWTLTESGTGAKTAALTMQIRNAATLVVLDTAVVTLEVIVDL